MSLRLAVACVWLSGLFLPCAVTPAADPSVTLQHNPFARPDLGNAVSERTQAVAVGPFEPQLRATLVAGRESLANIAGEFYGVGEEVGGYRLVRIGEGFVVFERESQRVTAYIHVADNLQKEQP